MDPVGLVTYMLAPGLLEAGQGQAMAELASLVALGPFHLFEIPAWPPAWAGAVREVLAGAGATVCTQTTSIRGGWDLGAVGSAAADRARSRLAEAAELAEAMGARSLAIWAGRAVDERSAHRRALVGSITWLLERYPDVTVVIEPFPSTLMDGSWVETAEDAAVLCDEVGPGLRVMYDCSHEAAGGQPAVPGPGVVTTIGTVQITSPWWSAATGFEDRHPPFGAPGAITWDTAKEQVETLLSVGVVGPMTMEVRWEQGLDAEGLTRQVCRWGEELESILRAAASRRVQAENGTDRALGGER